MIADLPVHPAISLLLMLLPFVWVLARTCVERFVDDRDLVLGLTPAVAIAGLVLAIHVAGLLTGSFYAGLTIAMTALGAIGMALLRRRRPAHLRPEPPAHRWRYRFVLAGVVLSMVPSIVFFDFHDNEWHWSTTAQILNDVYPPRSMAFPDLLWVYHYGIDELFATAAALLRIRENFAQDVVAILLWVYTAHLFGISCRLLFGRPYDELGLLVGCFSGGLPWLASWDIPSSPLELQGVYAYLGPAHWGNPPLVSNFLQYPWALGIPLMLVLFILIELQLRNCDEHGRSNLTGLWLLWLVLLTLAVTQTVGFMVAMVATAIFAVSLAFGDPGRRQLGLHLGICVVLCAAVVPLIGAMIGPLSVSMLHGVSTWLGVSEPAGAPMDAHVRFWHPAPLLTKLRWNLASFGVLPIGLLYVSSIRRARGLAGYLAIVFAVSWAVMNLFYYEKSWDIVKFAVPAAVALAILGVGLIRDLWRRGRELSLGRRRLPVYAAGGVLFASIIAPGIAFQASLLTEIAVDPTTTSRDKALWRDEQSLDADTRASDEAIAWLRKRIRPGEMVMCSTALGYRCAVFGGLPQIGVPMGALLVDEVKLRERRALVDRGRPTPEQLASLNVCWAISPSGTANQEYLRSWSVTGQTEVVWRSPPRRRDEAVGSAPRTFEVTRLCPDPGLEMLTPPVGDGSG